MSNDAEEALTELSRILGPHDAALKRYRGGKNTAQSRNPRENHQGGDRDTGAGCVQREFIHAAECPWVRIQELTKELDGE